MHLTNNAGESFKHILNNFLNFGKVSVEKFNSILNTVNRLYDAK